MQITLNGQAKALSEKKSVAGLLRDLELDPIRVAVEINEELVSRKIFNETNIQEGDRIEVVTFVGGG